MPISRFGLESIQLVEICVDLEKLTGQPIGPDLIGDFPSIEVLVDRVIANQTEAQGERN
jgi:acyl carrier protein